MSGWQLWQGGGGRWVLGWLEVRRGLQVGWLGGTRWEGGMSLLRGGGLGPEGRCSGTLEDGVG